MHDIVEWRVEAERCERAKGKTRDNSLRRQFAARVREFASLADVLERGGEKAKRRRALSKRRSISRCCLTQECCLSKGLSTSGQIEWFACSESTGGIA